MYGVELYAAVRLAVVDEGLSHHEAGRRFGIDRRTVKKMLSYSAPPGYRQPRGGRVAPRAGPSHGLCGQATTEPVVHFCAAAPVHIPAAVDIAPKTRWTLRVQGSLRRSALRVYHRPMR